MILMMMFATGCGVIALLAYCALRWLDHDKALRTQQEESYFRLEASQATKEAARRLEVSMTRHKMPLVCDCSMDDCDDHR